MGMSTQLRIFVLLEREPGLRPIEIAAKLKLRTNQLYQALYRLRQDGRIEGSAHVRWWRRYSVIRGALPPDDGRGHAVASLRALAAGRPAHKTFGPCALAECLNMLPFPMDNKRQKPILDTRVPEVRPEYSEAAD